jgi:hypothetical protein
MNRVFAGWFRLIGYGGQRCYVCRTSRVSHRSSANGKYVCATCAISASTHLAGERAAGAP